jgi:very-short-patch-repair endonuclease
MRVDAVWEQQLLAVEVDGGPAHASWARIKRDRQRELALRARGFHVVRYTWKQVTGQSDEVASDLRRLLRI